MNDEALGDGRNGGKKVLDFGKKFKIEKKIDPSIWRETYDLRER